MIAFVPTWTLFTSNSNEMYDYGNTTLVSDRTRVYKGGSWKDIGYYLRNSTRTFEYQDTAKSYIGYRNVMTHLGRGGRDFTKEGGEEIRSDIQLR